MRNTKLKHRNERQIENQKQDQKTMGLGRAILCVIFPPLAVYDKGCGSILLVVLLTIAGWVPGVIAAVIICKKN